MAMIPQAAHPAAVHHPPARLRAAAHPADLDRAAQDLAQAVPVPEVHPAQVLAAPAVPDRAPAPHPAAAHRVPAVPVHPPAMDQTGQVAAESWDFLMGNWSSIRQAAVKMTPLAAMIRVIHHLMILQIAAHPAQIPPAAHPVAQAPPAAVHQDLDQAAQAQDRAVPDRAPAPAVHPAPAAHHRALAETHPALGILRKMRISCWPL